MIIVEVDKTKAIESYVEEHKEKNAGFVSTTNSLRLSKNGYALFSDIKTADIPFRYVAMGLCLVAATLWIVFSMVIFPSILVGIACLFALSEGTKTKDFQRWALSKGLRKHGYEGAIVALKEDEVIRRLLDGTIRHT